MRAEDLTRDREADTETSHQVFEQWAVGGRERAHQQEGRGDRRERRLRQQDSTTARSDWREVDDFSHRNMVTGTAGPMIETDADQGAGF